MFDILTLIIKMYLILRADMIKIFIFYQKYNSVRGEFT